MTKQEYNQPTKVWTNVDYTNTWAYKTIQAWKQKAAEAGLVLEFPDDFPNDPAGQLEGLRRIDELTDLKKGPVEKTVTHMFRQLVHSKDKDGKPTVKECIYIQGQFNVFDYRGAPYGYEYKEGVYQEPNVVINTSRRYDQNTGKPIGNDKLLSGQRNAFWMELPKDKAARKKLIDNIIESTNSVKENINYYYQDLGPNNFANKSDATFSYDDFVNCSIEELQTLSARGGGSISLGYWRDKDNILRDRDGNKLS